MKALSIGVVVAAVVFIGSDMTWITLTGASLYRPVLGPILSDKVDIGAGLAFYALYLVGMLTFAIAPGIAARAWTRALGSGALLGLVAYGTYDLTNQATLKVWSINVTLTDMSWGAGITGLASAIGCAAALLATRRNEPGADRMVR